MDLSKVPTEELEKMLANQSQQAPTQQPQQGSKVDLSKLSTAQLESMAENHPDKPTSLLSKVDAAAVSFLNGMADSAEAVGGLANNILKGGAHLLYGKLLNDKETEANVVGGLNDIGDYASKGFNAARSVIKPNEYEQKSIAQNPRLSALAGTAGFLGGMVGGSNAIAAPLTKATDTALSTLAPNIVKSPIAQGTISQGVLGGVLGAASNPENPVQGAITGATIGAPLGGLGGALGAKLKRSGDIVDFETDNIVKAGQNPYSVESISRIRKSLKDNGVDMSRNQIQGRISDTIKSKIQDINPLSNLNQAPSVTIANLAKENYKTVTDKFNATKEPLVKSTEQFETPNLKQAVSSQDVSKLKLPDNMPANPTFEQMWTYRQQLDDVLSAGYKRLKQGNEVKYNIIPIQNMRDAVTADLEVAANKMGLGENWNQLNQIYQKQILPFKAFKTGSGKLNTDADVNDAITNVNILLKARNLNYNRIDNIAKSLGPDGQEYVGQAMLQRMYMDSMTDKPGVINPKTFFQQVRKANSLGISTNIWGLKTRQAAKGILNIIDGADETLKLGSPQDAISFYQKLPGLLTNRAGISLLRLIGSSKTPQKSVRAIIQQLITGITAIGNSKAEQQQQPVQ